MSYSGTVKRILTACAALGLVVALSAREAAAQVSALTGWISGTTNTKVAGSNRLMVVMVMGEHGAAFSATGVTYGGQAMTKQTEITSIATGTKNYAAIFTLKENGVNAATSGTIAVTWSPTPSAGNSIYSVLLSGVDQTTPVSAVAQNSLGATNGTTVSTNQLAAASGDMVIYNGTTGGDYNITANNGFLEQFESGPGGSWGDGVGGYKMGTGVLETPSFSSSAITRMVICAIVVKKDASGTNYTLTMTNDGNGTTTPTGAVSVAQGAATPISASPTPGSGYSFLNWTVTSGAAAIANANSASTTVTLNSGNATVRANFALSSYTLTMENDGNGTTTPSGTQAVTHGVSTPINATPVNSGFAFQNWTVTSGTASIAVPTSASTTVTLSSGNATVKANFVAVSSGWTTGPNGVTTTSKVGIGTDASGAKLSVSDNVNDLQATFFQNKNNGKAEISVGSNNMNNVAEQLTLGYDADMHEGYLKMSGGSVSAIGSFLHFNSEEQIITSNFAFLTTRNGSFQNGLDVDNGLRINTGDLNISNGKITVNNGVDIAAGNLNIPNGKITVKSWSIEAPDYVFEPGYKLPSLKQVEEFVTINKHLPEVPSAKEMTAKGIDITEMNLRLLKKVEELTLYVIEQDKKLAAQQREIQKLTRAVQK